MDFISNTARGNIFLGPDRQVYEIDQIIDHQTLHIVVPYAGATVQSGTYSVIPTQAYVQQLTQSASSLLNTFGAFRDDYVAGNLVGKGLQLKGVLSDPSQLPSSPSVGDGYLINASIYVWTGPAWQSSSIKGDPGDVTPAYTSIGNQVAANAQQTALDRAATSQSAAAAAASAQAIQAVAALVQSLTANASCQSTVQRPIPTYVGQSCLDMQLGYVVYARQLNPPIWQNAEGVYPL
ncbi:hypothetical protein ACO0K2_11720 [Undibacterium sp. MH2W]|uniref:hypothetical protein n=1 Tax=Undibacterium sp. MH2W TaxID=3413044 RepID=UPI003BF07E14